MVPAPTAAKVSSPYELTAQTFKEESNTSAYNSHRVATSRRPGRDRRSFYVLPMDNSAMAATIYLLRG